VSVVEHSLRVFDYIAIGINKEKECEDGKQVFHVYVGLEYSDVPGHFQEAYIYFILRNIEHYLADKYSNSTAAVQGSRYGDTVNVHTHSDGRADRK
jgi:hypothetical protein